MATISRGASTGTRLARLGRLLTVDQVRRVLILDVGTSVAGALLCGVDLFQNLATVLQDPTRTPRERLAQAARVAAALAATGALVILHVRGTRHQLDELTREATSLENLEQLRAPPSPDELDLDRRPLEGDTGQTMTATVDVEPEDVVTTRPGRVRPPEATARATSDFEYAILPNGERVPARPVGRVYHAVAGVSGDDRAAIEALFRDGLPERGPNRALLDHVNGAPDRSFRGSTVAVFVPGSGQGAATWAGDGGIIVEIPNARGWNPEQLLDGRVPQAGGGYGGIPPGAAGEHEITIPGRVRAEEISRVGIVRERRGNLAVQEWIENPNYRAPDSAPRDGGQ